MTNATVVFLLIFIVLLEILQDQNLQVNYFKSIKSINDITDPHISWIQELLYLKRVLQV